MLNQHRSPAPNVSLMSALALLVLLLASANGARAQTGDTYSLPEVSVGDRYEYTIPLVGMSAVKWEVVKGSLPPGIDLGQMTGTLFGRPTEAKSYLFTVRVTDSGKNKTEYQLELVVGSGSPTLLLPIKGKGGGQPAVASAGAATRRAGAPAGRTTPRREGGKNGAQSGDDKEEEDGEKEDDDGEKDDDTDEGDKASKKLSVDRPLSEEVAKINGYVPGKNVTLVEVDVYPAKPADAAPLRTLPAAVQPNGRFSADVGDVSLARGQKVRARAEMPDPADAAKVKKLVSEPITVERETRVQTTLTEGGRQIVGIADPKAGLMFADICVGEKCRQIGFAEVNKDTGAFTIPLENALKRQDEVHVYREGGTPIKLEVGDSRPPELKPSLLEGARTVTGYLRPGGGKAVVQVLPENDDRPLFQSEPVTPSAETGKFSVTLEDGLVAGQRVRASVENTETWSREQTVETLGDWGRVRGYFGVGVTLSKERDNFSRKDLFFNFNIDSNWYHRPRYSAVLKNSEQGKLVEQFLGRFSFDPSVKETEAAKAIEAEKINLKGELKNLDEQNGLSDEERMATRRVLLMQSLKRLKDNSLITGDREELIEQILKKLARGGPRTWDLHLNTFFDVRLTPVPIAGQDTASGDVGADAFGNFVTNEKGAQMQVGAYAPIFNHRTMTWNYQGSPNAVFFGPIGRVGVQTIFDKGKLADGSLGDKAVFADNDLFNFFAFGMRFGHYKLSESDDRAPQLISYLDITRGRWQNLERRVDTGEKNAAGENIFVRRRPFRWALEGRLKIPSTPLLIGFDSNIGEGPDDLRFLFGTNFDVSQLFKLFR